MKKRIVFILAAVCILAVFLVAFPFFVFAEATSSDADFMLTDADGNVTYHYLTEFTEAASPTITTSAKGVTKVELLRNITYDGGANKNANLWFYGNIEFNGNGYTYTYTGTDYAISVANDTQTKGYSANVAPENMKTAKFENLVLTGTTSVSGEDAGGLKAYNSILELGDGNVMKSQDYIAIMARSSGKLTVSGGYYTNTDTSKAFFSIGGDITYEGTLYENSSQLLISGGVFEAECYNSYAFRFSGSEANPTQNTVTISGGEFTPGMLYIGSVQNGNLVITGGTFYGDINVENTATATVTGGFFDRATLTGEGDIEIGGSAVFSDPVVARLYAEGSSTPYREFTQREFIINFSISNAHGVSNILSSDAALSGKSRTLEIVENIYTWGNQLGFYTAGVAGKSLTVNGNGKTVTGNTVSNPVLRGYKVGNLVFNNFNLTNEGASCFQFYNDITVDINDCIWNAPNHRTIFPTNSGTVNVNSGTVLRGGASCIYFNIQSSGLSSTINVNEGATVIGTGNDVINFQGGSSNGTVNLNSGSSARVMDSVNGYVIFIAADSTSGDNILVAKRNTVNVNDAVIEGLIADRSTATGEDANKVNLNTGTLYTDLTRSEVEAVDVVTMQAQFVIATPVMTYTVTIPELITLSENSSERLNISADLWRFSNTASLQIGLTSANGFLLNYENGGTVDPIAYTVSSSQTGIVSNSGTVAYYTNENNGETVNLSLQATSDLSDLNYAGVYSDTLTFTLTYSEDATLPTMPVVLPKAFKQSDIDQVEWHLGFVGSDTHLLNGSETTQQWTLVKNVSVYNYTDIFIVPEAGSTVTVIDYYDLSGTQDITPDSVFVFSAWELSGGEWVADRDGAVGDINRRGRTLKNGVVQDGAYDAEIAGSGTTAEGLHYVVWSYTTKRDNEALRICLRVEDDKDDLAVPVDAKISIARP